MTDKANWGGKREPGPGKRLGRPPRPYPSQILKIRATTTELEAIHRLDTRERATILLERSREMALISITDLEEYGNTGWRWVESYLEPYAEEQTERECRTNINGAGLFVWDEHQRAWRQTRGTSQFYLPKKRKSAYNAIRRRIRRDVFQL